MEARFRSDGTRVVENFVEKTHMEIAVAIYQSALDRGTDEDSAFDYGISCADTFVRRYLRNPEGK